MDRRRISPQERREYVVGCVGCDSDHEIHFVRVSDAVVEFLHPGIRPMPWAGICPYSGEKIWMRADSARDDMDSSDEWASILLVIATRYRAQATGEDPGDARDKIIEEARGG